MKQVMIMAGGTGGHVVPGLALAQQLMPHMHVHWLASQGGFELKLLANTPHTVHVLRVQAWRQARGWRRMVIMWGTWRAVWDAWRVLRSVKPDLVISMGGFVAGPGGLVARVLRIPLIVHEQNSVPGFTNRCLARWARHVCVAFPHTWQQHPRVICVGNPVRASIEALPPPSVHAMRERPLRVLVLGGSKGAQILNQILPQALALMPQAQQPEIWHQSGVPQWDTVRHAYTHHALSARVDPFIEAMDTAYAWADLVVARAGAMTVSELAAAGRASVLVPYPHATDNHQWHNANHLVHQGAAVCVLQEQLTAPFLCATLSALLENPDTLHTMALHAKECARPHASEHLARLCLEACTP